MVLLARIPGRARGLPRLGKGPQRKPRLWGTGFSKYEAGDGGSRRFVCRSSTRRNRFEGKSALPCDRPALIGKRANRQQPNPHQRPSSNRGGDIGLVSADRVCTPRRIERCNRFVGMAQTQAVLADLRNLSKYLIFLVSAERLEPSTRD
jgi:hypothetical protein